jgi:amidophosphoribosyltransferase
VRYSTAGGGSVQNAQPIVVDCNKGRIALAHNGNISNGGELRAALSDGGSIFQGTADSELILHALSRSRRSDREGFLREALEPLEGAYSLAVMHEDALIAIRDPSGFRPLYVGHSGSATYVASETCALHPLAPTDYREVRPGEVVIFDDEGEHSFFLEPRRKPRRCVFELIYFARPDSVMEGRNLYEVRRRMGMELAAEHVVAADLVMPVPDTGGPAAAGYAEASGIPFREGMYRNRYAGRTFIQPSQAMRHRGVTVKLNPLRDVVRGQRLVVVDDSIVRGTTTRSIVGLLRKAGAAEVHVRISAPPIYHPCFYGIDTQIETELIAASHTVEEIRAFIEADSLGYLSIPGLLRALELPYEGFCFACFDGRYPVPVPYDVASRKFILEEAPVGRG